MYGYIYKTTNKINNKIYIGQKKSEIFLNESYLGSGKYLKHAIKKYGKENFTIELVDTADSKEDLNKLEIYYIDLYKATDKTIGYNIAKGGVVGCEVYVNNGIKNEFIPKASLETYLNDGWQLGMLPGRKEINHSKTRSSSISKALSGIQKSEEHRLALANSVKNSHYHWYTSGIIDDNIRLKDGDIIPEGYYRGRTLSDDIKQKCGTKNIGKTPWNKGLTKETNEIVKQYSINISNTLKLKTDKKEG